MRYVAVSEGTDRTNDYRNPCACAACAESQSENLSIHYNVKLVPKNTPHGSNLGIQKKKKKSFWGSMPPEPTRKGVPTHTINGLAPFY